MIFVHFYIEKETLMFCRVTSVPHSRSVMVDLSPSVRTVRPEPRSMLWRSEKNRNVAGKNDLQPGIIFSIDEQQARIGAEGNGTNENDAFDKEKVTEGQVVPPPTPDLLQGITLHDCFKFFMVIDLDSISILLCFRPF